MQRLASSTFSIVTNAKPRGSLERGSTTIWQSKTFPSLLKNFSRSELDVRVDRPVTYRLLPGFLRSSLLLERLLFLDLDLDLDLPRLLGEGDLDLPRFLGEEDLDLPRLLGGGDLEALLRLLEGGGGDLEERMRTAPLGGNGGGGGSGGDLDKARLLGGGDALSLSAPGGVMERAVYLTSLHCDIYQSAWVGRRG